MFFSKILCALNEIIFNLQINKYRYFLVTQNYFIRKNAKKMHTLNNIVNSIINNYIIIYL